ncbi:MAG: hypothetical protein HY063_06865 [Bacteroidetes bacterium]|nr:hypothetical protein [Bacteroidota bacterium]
MKKLFTFTIALFSFAGFLFAGSTIPGIPNGELVAKNNLHPYSLSLNLPEQNLFAKKHGGQAKNAFGEGTIVISAGYGFGNFTQALFSFANSFGGYSYSSIGPIHGKFEYGLSDNIGVGLSMNYIGAKAKWNDTYDVYNSTTGNYDTYPCTNEWDFSSLSILARFNVHFATTEKLDPYWGIGAGYRSGSWSQSSTCQGGTTRAYPSYQPFGFETTFGLRYYFTDNIGLYSEIGWAKAVIQFGVAVKL